MLFLRGSLAASHRGSARLLHRLQQRKFHPNKAVSLFPHLAALPDRPPRRIVFGSCSSQNDDLSYWDRIVEVAPDLVILMGDNVYGQQAPTLMDAYQDFALNPHVEQALRQIPVVATLDDNDYGPNRDEGKTVFLDVFRASASDERRQEERGVYTSYQWDDRLQIILLDCRYHADSFDPNEREGQGSPCDTNRTLLGETQWEWLESQLQQHVKTRLLVSPIQVIPVQHPWDSWNRFPLERDRLLAALDIATGRTIVLSGDRHLAAVYQQPHGGLVEVTSSSLTHTVPKTLVEDEEESTRIGSLICENNFGLLEVDFDTNKVKASILCTVTGGDLAHEALPMVL